ncbi:MAG: putative rane protein [Anaerocolumna sp.]|nr:putative rane protein [Anaerocolumna sp.]
MKIKKTFIYFISFFSLAIMFSASYYLSYKSALKKFNENAVERNNELILSLEERQMLNPTEQLVENGGDTDNEDINSTLESTDNLSVPVDTITEDTILPTTQYKLEIYDLVTGNMTEEILQIPSYLVGLTREQVIEYLHNYLEDLPWSEFEKGLYAYDLLAFSKDNIVLRKVYNSELVEYKYYLKSQNGYIVVYYGDQKTVYEYTEVSVENLTQFEQIQLEEGLFIKDLDELYSALENYSS